MAPIALLALAGIAGLLYFSSKPAQLQLSPDAQKGASGKMWRTTFVKEDETHTYVNVWAEPNQFGPHVAFAVLQYKQLKGGGKESRKIVQGFPNVPAIAYNTAVADFGLSVGR